MSDILIDDAPQPQAVKGRSLWEDARRRLEDHLAALEKRAASLVGTPGDLRD